MRTEIHRSFRIAVLALATLALSACVAAIPLVIQYYSTPTEQIATAEVAASADKVYATVVQEAEGAGPGMKIVRRDDANRLIEINDGVQTATIKVIQEPDGETQIIVAATRVDRDAQKDLSVQVLLHLCREYGQACRVQEG